jgi:hypothetical protein
MPRVPKRITDDTIKGSPTLGRERRSGVREETPGPGLGRELGGSRRKGPQAPESRSCGSARRKDVNDEFAAVGRSDQQTLIERSSDDRADHPYPRGSGRRADL